ncbi:MAG: DNA polymerase III subunit delta [Sphingobium sp.]
MKANKGQIERALDAPAADIRLFLLYGPDEAGSIALAKRLERAMGPGAERIDLDSATLKGDPARLSDEAASFSMFGDKRWIRLSGFGDEVLGAIEALLQGERAGNPVVALGGPLKGTSKLVKLCLDHAAVMTFASYLPDEREAAQIAVALAHELGLRLSTDLARRIADLTGGDRALMAGEIDKIALYLDAAPERPAEATAEALNALSAEAIESDSTPLINAVMGGDLDMLHHELAMLDIRGASLASIFRPLLSRALMIATIRAELDRGGRLDAAMDSVGKAIFWKEKPVVQRQVKRWNARAIARAIQRLSLAERATRDSRNAGDLVVRHELLTIARQAARER